MRLDDPALEPIVAKAIIDSITPENREALISNAVKELLNRASGSGYNQPTNIQRLFNDAVSTAAKKMADQYLTEDPDFQAKLKGLFVDVSEKLFSTETRDELVTSLSDRIVAGLTRDRY